MYKSNGGDSVSSNGWVNANPYFAWTAGADDPGGSGIKGYCLYLGQDNTANPATTKGLLGHQPRKYQWRLPVRCFQALTWTYLRGLYGHGIINFRLALLSCG